MKHLQNIERGIQRLYYVAWAVAAGTGVFVTAYKMSRSMAKPESEMALTWAAVIAFWVFAPWIFMHVVRWVYRGFVPKPVEQTTPST